MLVAKFNTSKEVTSPGLTVGCVALKTTGKLKEAPEATVAGRDEFWQVKDERVVAQ